MASGQTSPHVGFYKSFGRPVAKVFLGAICVYQAAYWGWKKLEVDEMKREKTEIGALQGELDGLRGR